MKTSKKTPLKVTWTKKEHEFWEGVVAPNLWLSIQMSKVWIVGLAGGYEFEARAYLRGLTAGSIATGRGREQADALDALKEKLPEALANLMMQHSQTIIALLYQLNEAIR